MNATMHPENIQEHYPVMLNQILSIITPQHGGTFIDCTFGGGGYSKAILKYPNTKVIALDRDISVKKYADNIKKQFPQRFSFFQEKFSNLKNVVDANINPSAIIFDLGISSLQIADKNRGFSFKSEGPLKMQMGKNSLSAYDVINKLDRKILTKIFKILGEEKDGKKIANKIVQHRIKKKIETSSELAAIISAAKKNYNKFKKNPSTKAFQAIRIFVNKELTELLLGLISATELLSDKGILIVVSFHSLEDKIVKNFFNFYSNAKRNPSRYLPQSNEKKSLFKIISTKAIKPKIDEIEKNIRSRSAKLRYVIRNNNSFFYPTEIKNKFDFYFKIEEIKI